VYFNTFASGLNPHDMTESEEFASLLQSASELGIEARTPVRYRSRHTVVNGLRLHFLEWGEPESPPLVLLHGVNQSAHSWDLVSLVMAARYRVIAIDQRGHGDSEWPRDGDMSRPAMARDALELMRSLEAERPAIMAHSMGGLVTMSILIEQDLANRLVLVDIGPDTAREGRERISNFVRTAREFASIDEYVERVSAYDTIRSREHIMRTMRYNIMQRSDGMLVSKHYQRLAPAANAPAPNLPPPGIGFDEVQRIACPVLVVRGGESNVLLPEAAEKFVSVLRDGRLVTIPDCGHNVHTQNTPGFLAAVRPFLGV